MTGLFPLLACFGDPASDTVQETPVGLLPCEAPTPSYLTSGAPDGLVICADGSQNRVEAVTLPAWEPTGCLDVVEPGQHDVGFACTEDADCPAGNYCDHIYYEPFGEGCECAPLPCRSDSECGAGEACVRGNCVSAACTTDADCASGQCGFWSEGWYEHGDYWVTSRGLACRSAQDACRGGTADTCALCIDDFQCGAY